MTSPKGINDFAEHITKSIEDLNTLVSSYVSAANKSSAAAWKGVEDISQSMTTFVKDSVARSANAYSAMTSVKSPKEAVDMQQDFMKTSFDNMVAGGSKISEISIHAVKSTMDPLTQHTSDAVTAVIKKAKTP